jgi:hypothetical protein
MKISLWRISESGELAEVGGPAGSEDVLKDLLVREPRMISDDLAVIGREVKTDRGLWVDLLGVNSDGDLVIIELKTSRAPRDVVAQLLEYGAWASRLTPEDVEKILSEYGGKLRLKYNSLGELFEERFNVRIDEVEVNGEQEFVLVAEEVDSRLLDVIDYLRDYGLKIKVFLYKYVELNGGKYIAFLRVSKEEEPGVSVPKIERRRQNLKESLERKARENGVENLYRRAVERLGEVFMGQANKGLYAFKARIKPDSWPRVIIRVNVSDSSRGRGLNFEVYTKRLADYLGTSIDEVKREIFPSNADIVEWKYTKKTVDIEWSGHEWYFKSTNEIDEFVDKIKERLRRKEEESD